MLTNVCICDGIGLAFLAMLLISNRDYFRKEKRTKNLMNSVITAMFACTADILAFALDGVPGTGVKILLFLVNSGLFLAMMMVSFFWMQLECDCMGIRPPRFSEIIVYGINSVGIAALIVNIFHPLAFSLENNVYRREWFYLAFVVIGAVNIIYTFFLYFFARKQGRLLVSFNVGIFLVPAVVGVVVQSLFYGISVIWVGIAVGITGVTASIKNSLIFIDSLTQVYNRYYLDKFYMGLQAGDDVSLSGILLDINGFKKINDVYGHDFGDKALMVTADILFSAVKGRGKVIRYGGDEFVILIDSTDPKVLSGVMEKIEQGCERFTEKNTSGFRLSVSMGSGVFYSHSQNFDTFLRSIDHLMYEKKQEYHRLNDPVEEVREEEIQELTVRIVSALSDSYSTLYYINSETGRYRIVNNSRVFAEQVEKRLLTGGSFYEDTRLNIPELIFEDDHSIVSVLTSRAKMEEAFAGRDSFMIEYRALMDGGPTWYRVSAAKINESSGAVSYVLGIMNIDNMIRQQEENQARLQNALIAAESANRAKTEFLFNMSHDIRTPMNAILGFTALAKNHTDDRKKLQDCLDKIQMSSNLLLSLINSVLDVSRIESGHIQLEKNPGDVRLSFAGVEDVMRELADSMDIQLSFEFGSIRDRYVYCDFGRCNRIFVNIVSNAIKYSRKKGYVRVRCEQLGEAENGYGTYCYTFEDNGIGMSEEFQKHVYEQFSRENSAELNGIQGAGLGLSVCKAFVDLMGGTISCRSKLGEGTTFTVILPFRIQEDEFYTHPYTGEILKEADEEPEIVPPDYVGRKILLVEDNEMNRELEAEILTETGLIVEMAEDGAEAVELLRSKGPDYYSAVLMDVQMPVMDGYEATKNIRTMYPDAELPIIAVSANAFDEDRERSRKAGMSAHLSKPVNVEEILAILAKHLRSERSL